MAIAPVTAACPGCCGGTPCFSLYCRSRGGNAKLCGHAEFGTGSNPPRFYKEKEVGGNIVVCDFHTPGGMGYPACYEDCASPIGTKAEVTFQWDCPGGPAGSADTFNTATIECMDAYAGGSGVELLWKIENTATGHDPFYYGFAQGYINGALFAAATANKGPANFTRSAAAGTKLGVEVVLTSACSPVGSATGYPSPNSAGSTAGSGIALFEYCIPRYTSDRYSYSGKSIIDPAIDCLTPSSDTMQVTLTSAPKGCIPPTTGGTSSGTASAFLPDLGDLVQIEAISSGPTYRAEIGLDTCKSDKKAKGTRWSRLTEEFTEGDAIDKLLAGPGGVWGDWRAVADGTGMTCINPDCCRAVHEERTSRDFEYKEVEYKGRVEGLVPGNGVTMYFPIYRRSVGGGGLYELYQTDTHYVVADLSGVAESDPTAVPNEIGYETYVGSCRWALGAPLPP